MSEVVITLKSVDNGFTHVIVDGRLAYKTIMNCKNEKQNIEALIQALVIENTKVEIK